MISSRGLSDLILPFAPAIANHLWQSTLVGAGAALLALAFRRNHARVRYGIWLAASIKFLIPFTLVSFLGSHLRQPHSALVQPALYTAVENASQPVRVPDVASVPSTKSFSTNRFFARRHCVGVGLRMCRNCCGLAYSLVSRSPTHRPSHSSHRWPGKGGFAKSRDIRRHSRSYTAYGVYCPVGVRNFWLLQSRSCMAMRDF